MIFSHRRSAPLDAQREVWGWEVRAFVKEKAPTQQNLSPASRVRFAERKKIILPRCAQCGIFSLSPLTRGTNPAAPTPPFPPKQCTIPKKHDIKSGKNHGNPVVTRLSKRIFVDPITGEAPPVRLCDHEGCTAEGLYPAPQSPGDLRRYYWFCLSHVQDYNRRWDFYRDMPEDVIETSREDDRLWNRLRSSRASLNVEEFLYTKQPRNPPESDIPAGWRDLDLPTLQALRESLKILGLANPRVDFDTIQKTYKALAKKHHPDQQHTTAEDEEKMKDINAAYAVLRRNRVAVGG